MATQQEHQLIEHSTATDDIQQLPQMIAAWKDVQAETLRLKEELRERNVRKKALEEVIMRIMKTHNIGALDLKTSNARLLHKQKQSKGTLNKKTMAEYLGEFLKSEEEGKKAVAFLDEKRGVVKKDVLSFEHL